MGPEAYDTFRALASVFYEGGPGTLLHPVWQSAQVYFVALALTQEPRKDYVRYTFTFWETYSRYRDTLAPAGPPTRGAAPSPGVEPLPLEAGPTRWPRGRPCGASPRPGGHLGGTAGEEPPAEEPQRDPAGASADDAMRRDACDHVDIDLL